MWFLKLFFDLLYHSFAWSYDLVAALVSGGRWQNWVRSVAPLVQGQRVLELGIGTGTLQAALAESGLTAFGLDESRQMLRIATYHNSKHSAHLKLLRADARNVPFASQSIDAIVATFPSEYILQPETLHSCRRVLRPGGRLVILLGVQVGGKSLLNRLLRLLYRVTGQGTPELHALEKSLQGLTRYDFDGKIEQIRFREDILTVIVAV